MKELTASFLISLSKLPTVTFFLKVLYKTIEKNLSKKLKNIPGIKSIYIKGSYASETYIVGISDIDYIIISDSEKASESVKNTFKKYNAFFPFIGDNDIYSDQELAILLRYGSNKYRNNRDWKHIYGPDLRVDNYAYYPLKFFVEQIHELFFYLEWLSVNFNKNINKSSLYRRAVLERGIEKILACLDWIDNSADFHFSKDFKNKDSQLFTEIKNDILQNRSLHKLSEYISQLEAISYFHQLLPREFNWFEKNEDQEDLEDGNCLVRVGNFEYIKGTNQTNSRKDRFIFSEDLTNLFTKLGCFHFDHLFNFSINASNRLCGSIIKLFAYTKIIEGNTSEIFNGDFQEILELDNEVSQKISLNIKKPHDLKGNTVFVSVNWGEDKRRFWALEKSAEKLKYQSLKLPWFHFDMNFSSEELKEHPSHLTHIRINGDESNRNLWQKECMYNFSAHYCFGAKNYIFSDADVYSEDLHWFEKMKTLLNSGQYDFVHGFARVTDTDDPDYSYESWTKKYLEDEITFTAPGLIWGIPRKTFIKLEHLPDIFPDGSNDGALLQELTNVKMGLTSKFDWYSSRIRTFKEDFKITYCDVDVIHCNHGVSRDYINRVTLIDLVKTPFEKMYNKNCIGIYAWSESGDYKQALDLANLYFKLDSNRFIEIVDSLIEKGIIKVPEEMTFLSEYPHENILTITNGIAFLYSTGENKYKVMTSMSNHNSQIKMRWGGYDLMDNEHLYAKFLVKKETKEPFDISVNYNWWRLAGSNNTYDKKYFQSMTEQPLGVCASSWEDHAIAFIDLETTQKTPGETYEISKIEEERINFFHAWDILDEIEVTFDDIVIHKNSFDISLGKKILNKNGWFKIDLRLDGPEKVPLKLTVVAGSKNIPVTTTRLFDDSSADYIRVLFNKNLYMNDLRVRIKLDIKKNVEFEKANILINERRKI